MLSISAEMQRAEAKSAPITGAEIVVRSLVEEGVEHVFGYPGGAVLYIYDEIFKQDKFQHILVRHEQAAVHAADAYSRSSNRIRMSSLAVRSLTVHSSLRIRAPWYAVRML